ncbi:hypothetical protein KP509_02G032900 [Ceratopteris richardii]|nr:hypothetical protein KP509_02G032900 [Ceratopteris richardii]
MEQTEVHEGLKVDGTTRIHVQRPSRKRDGGRRQSSELEDDLNERKQEEEEEEILALRGVRVTADAQLKVDVYISHKDHNACQICSSCSDCALAGSFLIVPSRPRSSVAPLTFVESNHRIGISDVVRNLGIHEDDGFYLSLVPSTSVSGTCALYIRAICLEYE